jgi:hypothetical protein
MPEVKYATLPPLGVVPFVMIEDMLEREHAIHPEGKFP